MVNFLLFTATVSRHHHFLGISYPHMGLLFFCSIHLGCGGNLMAQL